MIRRSLGGRGGRRASKALVGVALAALSGLACDNSMTFQGPTAPSGSQWLPGSTVRSLEISGVLQTVDGALVEATVLFDGRELPGARSRCPDASGCPALDLEGAVEAGGGTHTVSFQVLRQSGEAVEYMAQGVVLISGRTLALPGVTLPLGPRYARLDAGEAVTFDVELIDFE